MCIDTRPSQPLSDRKDAGNPRTTAKKLAAHFEHVETVDVTNETDDDVSVSSYTESNKSTTSGDGSNRQRRRRPRRHVPTTNRQPSDKSILSNQYPSDSCATTIPMLSVLDIIPSSFTDMYPAEVFHRFPPQLPHQPYYSSGQGLFTSFGIADLYLRRPSFTHRDLTDWEKNDLRALCMVTELKPEWLPDLPVASDPQSFTQIVPILKEEHFRIIVLPLTADNQTIVDTLSGSDLYVEFGFSVNHRVRLARETINICLSHRQNNAALTKPEWRRVIDNYLLGLACEAQGRVEFKKALTARVLHKQEQQLAKCRGNLLKRVLLDRARSSTSASPSSTGVSSSATAFLSRKTSSTSEFVQNYEPSTSTSSSHTSGISSSIAIPPMNISVSRPEQKIIWREVQVRLYARLGLDWEPSELAF
ncbi:hypothetical protein V1509DRAFT_628074 [Lipomyces kononenkoae]